MSFLEHLDELRRRLIRCFIFIFIAATASWFFSGRIYDFLAAPVYRALADAQRQQVPIAGQTGTEMIGALTSLKENDSGRYVFAEETKLGTSLIPAGASVTARVVGRGPADGSDQSRVARSVVLEVVEGQTDPGLGALVQVRVGEEVA